MQLQRASNRPRFLANEQSPNPEKSRLFMALLDLILWNSCTFIVIADFIESVKFLLVNGVVADHAQGCILLQGNSFSRPSSRHETSQRSQPGKLTDFMAFVLELST